MSTPSLLLGRSRTCPLEARTSNPGPRYFPMVRALAGDSTITRFFPRLPGRAAAEPFAGSSSSRSSSGGATAFRERAGAFALTAAFRLAGGAALGAGFALASDLPRTAGSILAITGSPPSDVAGVTGFAGLLAFFGVTSVRRVGSAGIEGNPVLVVEPVDQDLGRQLLRPGLRIERHTLFAGARHDLLELLGRDASRFVEAEEIGVGRRGEQGTLGAGRHAHVLAGDARLAGIILPGIGLQRPEDHLERLIDD